MNLEQEFIDLLEKKLDLSKDIPPEKRALFLEAIRKYLKNRTIYQTFEKNLEETIEFLETLHFDYKNIIEIIYRWPSIMHADKTDLKNKYVLLSLLSYVKYPNAINVRDIFVNHPKDLMTGIETIYARLNFFLSDDAEEVTRSKMITRRKIFKTTATEFENSYHISKEDLLKKYPYDEKELIETVYLYGGEELKKLYESQSIGKGNVKL